jgi:acyl-coenzyme A synthetase/AMP-(fatty) acid ligase
MMMMPALRAELTTAATTTFADELEMFGERPAAVTDARQFVTYRQLAADADALAKRLGQTRRLVFVEAANSIAALTAYVACLRARHPMLLWSRLDRQKLDSLIAHYQPNVVVSSSAAGPELSWVHRNTHDLHQDLAVLLSTSGSTGSPKLVRLSAASVDSNARAIAAYLQLSTSERAITSLRFNYSYGMSIVNSHLATGAALVLTEDSVTDASFWETFRRAGATSFAGVPYTFESLHQGGFDFATIPTLRYATQAGGRLAPALVARYAELARSQNWRFYVMYGQTEAAPRIAYLPPEQAHQFPDCIGRSIPGGRIDLVADDGTLVETADTPGQLVYTGPNVMMGYAEHREDLALDAMPQRLITGDIACRNSAGLFYIVGRAARFVKPFGFRVNLDDIESRLQAAFPGARCAGDDQHIVVALTQAQMADGHKLVASIATDLSLPEFVFRVAGFDDIPRLPGGKVDYARILDRRRPAPADPGEAGIAAAARVVFSSEFRRQWLAEFVSLIGVSRRQWLSVAHIYETLLNAPKVDDADTFRTLAGDSLSYVQVIAALTEYLGLLPEDWPDRPVRDLEALRIVHHAPAV